MSFYDDYYNQAASTRSPYTQVWMHEDGRVLGVVNEVYHRLSVIPPGYKFSFAHPLDKAVKIYFPSR
jgi:hypothetical protein